MTFSPAAIVVGVLLLLLGLVWIGLLQRRQAPDGRASLPKIALFPVALVIVGAGLLALQILSGDPFAHK